MYPTMFRIPFLPEAWADVRSYGVMMMVAFLGGIWLACRRAVRVKADPDVILNMGFIALIAGVVGARAFFVMHYWTDRFANQASPMAAVFDIRAGGLEFWGGPMLVIPALLVYLLWSKHSLRWYLDISGPSLMFGMAMARIGCFLNGCCWGSVCVNEHDPAHREKGLPWAVTFPYASPSMSQQFEFGQMTVPKELMYTMNTGQTILVPREYVEAGRDELDGPAAQLRAAEEELTAGQRLGADAAALEKLRTKVERLRVEAQRNNERYALLSEQCRRFGMLPSELRDLSRNYRSLPVHPVQLYAMVTGLLLYWLLDTLFYYRKRHGIVLPWLLILYSFARVCEESIRQDNPLDVGGVTISQFVSALMAIVGVASLLYLRGRPLKCPLAVRFELPEEAHGEPVRA